MDRRSFLKTTGAAAGAAAGASVAGAAHAASTQASDGAPALASGTRELRVASAWPDAVAGPADDTRRLLASLVEASDGKWRFRVLDLPAGTTAINALSRGEADLLIASDNAHTALDPAFGYFGGLPGSMGLVAHDLEAWLVAGGGQLLWDDLGGHHGVKPLLAGHLGAPAGLWSQTPLKGLDDIEGAAIAANGLALDVARGLGAEAVRAGHEAAIVQGAGLLTDLAFGLPEHARHYYTGSLMPAGTTVTLGVARGLWDGLSGTERAILAGAASAAWRESLAAQKIHAQLALSALQQAHPVVVAPLPAEIARQIDRVSEAVVAHAAGSSARARAIDASLMAYLHATGRNLSVQSVA